MPAAAKKRTRRLRASIALGSLAFLIAAALWFIGVLGGNVREVDPGRYYRSAQLTGATLENAMRRFRIASVINLRGAHLGTGYYDSELQVCRQLGARHEDVSLSATRLPPPSELQKLLGLFDKMPRPLMVHCQAGSDRTGLASTLYANLYEGMPLDAAEASQLTWRYGHFKFTRTGAMDRFFDLYRQSGRRLGLRDWISTDYPSLYRGLARANDPAIRPEDTRP